MIDVESYLVCMCKTSLFSGSLAVVIGVWCSILQTNKILNMIKSLYILEYKCILYIYYKNVNIIGDFCFLEVHFEQVTELLMFKL